jgi:hypothetical protein
LIFGGRPALRRFRAFAPVLTVKPNALGEENHMIMRSFATMRPVLTAIGVLAIAALGVAETPAHAQGRKHREDARTCSSFGIGYGTPGYGNCMLEQQRRRDFKQQKTLEEMALTSQIAKDGQIMAERARRQRCDRNPDRRECRRR